MAQPQERQGDPIVPRPLQLLSTIRPELLSHRRALDRLNPQRLPLQLDNHGGRSVLRVETTSEPSTDSMHPGPLQTFHRNHRCIRFRYRSCLESRSRTRSPTCRFYVKKNEPSRTELRGTRKGTPRNRARSPNLASLSRRTPFHRSNRSRNFTPLPDPAEPLSTSSSMVRNIAGIRLRHRVHPWDPEHGGRYHLKTTGSWSNAISSTTIDPAVQEMIKEDISNDPDFEHIIRTLKGLPVEKVVPSSLLKHYSLGSDGMLRYDLTRVCIPRGPLRIQILHDHHDAPIAGHQGIERTYATLHPNVYWPRMNNDIRKYVKSCDSCQRIKASQQVPAGLLQPLPIPSQTIGNKCRWTL